MHSKSGDVFTARQGGLHATVTIATRNVNKSARAGEGAPCSRDCSPGPTDIVIICVFRDRKQLSAL